MARKIVAGNWKMNGTGADLAELPGILGCPLPDGAAIVICPPATLLHRMASLAAGRIGIGGQDCHAAAQGAHTGDVSAAMLADAGASHVILGHSERRADHGETDAAVAAKVAAALAAGLTPILCVGETLAERDAGHAAGVVAAQLDGSLPGDMAGVGRLIVAYEPVWAIGSGRVPAPEDIAAMHRLIRARLAARFGADAAAAVPLLYGGSVKPDNAVAILALPDVDGALVGGASLNAGDFAAIVAALPRG